MVDIAALEIFDTFFPSDSEFDFHFLGLLCNQPVVGSLSILSLVALLDKINVFVLITLPLLLPALRDISGITSLVFRLVEKVNA